MMQEIISGPITNQFINHCLGLRTFIIQLETDNILNIDEDNIDFDNCCNPFLNKSFIFEDNGDTEDGEHDEHDEDDVNDNENDESKEQKNINVINVGNMNTIPENEQVRAYKEGLKTILGTTRDHYEGTYPHLEKVIEDCSK